MDLNERNVIESLSEIAPYIEADGGYLQFVEIEEETNFVKVILQLCKINLFTNQHCMIQ